MSIDEATIAEIVRELGSSGVYVDDALAARLPESFQADLRAQVAESAQPVFVVMIPVDRNDPNFHGDDELLAGVVHSDLGRDGVYLTYDQLSDAIDGTGYGTDFGLHDAWFAARLQHPKDLQNQLTQTITYLNNGKGDEAYERLSAQRRQEQEESGTSQPHSPMGDDHGMLDGMVGPGIIGLLLVGAAVAALRFRRRSSTPAARYVPGKGYVTSRPFELPAATLSMIRQSRDQELERRAERSVLALGEAIDRTEMKGTAEGSWQAALDHYDLSRRILDRKHSQADVVGALVLSARGESALEAARQGRRWSPGRTCYFNPLHGAGSRQVRWQGAAGAAQVPACTSCAAAIADGGEPDDVLDFVVDGRARHYFDLDLEPWSSTGYGAIDSDLTGRLFRG